MMRMKNQTGKLILVFAVSLLALALTACDSDLFGTPPASLDIKLVSPPVETVGFDSVSLDVTTDVDSTLTVDYGTTHGTYTASTPRTTTETKDHTVALSGLTPATTYYYRVVSWLGGARSFPSAEFSFTTDANPAFLSIATGPSATPALDSLSIAFTTNNACTYVVEYGTVSGTYTGSTLQTSVAATSHNAVISDLSSATTYYYRLKLYWNAGNDFVSGQYSEDTLTETAPTAAQKARGIWLLGGISTNVIGSTVAEVDMYDPVLPAWYPAVTSIPTQVSFAGYAAYDGQLFVIGGFNNAGAQQNLVQIYTVSTDTWSNGVTMTTARANINASVIYGRINILGGTNGADTAAWVQGNTYYEYSVGGNSWLTKLAVAGSERFSYVFNDAVYYLGGRITNGATFTNTHEGIVFTTNTVTTGTEVLLPTARTGIAGSLVTPSDGPACVVLIGGITGFTGTPACFVNSGPTAGVLISTVQYIAYPFTLPSAWLPAVPTTPPNYPSNIAFGSAVTSTAFSSPRVYHFGGTSAIGGSAAGQTASYWIAPPSPPATWSSAWNAITAMPRARWGHGAVTLNN